MQQLKGEKWLLEPIFLADEIFFNDFDLPRDPLITNNSCVSLMMCSNVIGTFKMPILVKEDGFCGCDTFKKWYEVDFVQQVKEYLRSNNLPIQAILIVKNSLNHPSSVFSLLEEVNGDFKIRPTPASNKKIHPIEYGISQSFRRNYVLMMFKEKIKKLQNNKGLPEFCHK